MPAHRGRYQSDKLVKICEEVLTCGEQSGRNAPLELRRSEREAPSPGEGGSWTGEQRENLRGKFGT